MCHGLRFHKCVYQISCLKSTGWLTWGDSLWTMLLMLLLVSEDQLRCFVMQNQQQKATFNSSHVALKSYNRLPRIDPKVMRMLIFKFRTAICVNVRLVKGQKAEILRIYHGHSMEKIGRSKKSFSSWNFDGACNRALHNCSLCASITFAPKKNVVYGLLFSLHVSADLRVTNPIRNPCLSKWLKSNLYTELTSPYHT